MTQGSDSQHFCSVTVNGLQAEPPNTHAQPFEHFSLLQGDSSFEHYAQYININQACANI
jgi:hypothetical protein